MTIQLADRLEELQEQLREMELAEWHHSEPGTLQRWAYDEVTAALANLAEES